MKGLASGVLIFSDARRPADGLHRVPMITGTMQTLVILAICGPIILIPAFIAMTGEWYLRKK